MVSRSGGFGVGMPKCWRERNENTSREGWYVPPRPSHYAGMRKVHSKRQKYQHQKPALLARRISRGVLFTFSLARIW